MHGEFNFNKHQSKFARPARKGRRDVGTWAGGVALTEDARGRAAGRPRAHPTSGNPTASAGNASNCPPVLPLLQTRRLRRHPCRRDPNRSESGCLRDSFLMHGAPDSYKVMSVIEQYPPARQDTLKEQGGWRGGGGNTPPHTPTRRIQCTSCTLINM